MSKLIFKPEMFEVEYIATSISSIKRDTDKYESAKSAQKAFDEWLEKQTVVWGYEKPMPTDLVKLTSVMNFSTHRTQGVNKETHKAYLVCIEEIKKCEHENVVNDQDMSGRTILDLWRCKDCNKQLKPKNGWEVASE